ncbi:MAG: CbiX/SirB N-terminal domain-containing protein [Thermodesulfobacteriota bacterium]
MNILLFAVHGSRKTDSNKEVENFFEKVKKNLDKNIDKAFCCFLQFGSPKIEEVLEDELQKGADTIYIFPYFLFQGSHVTEDIPGIKEKFEKKYPEAFIKILNTPGEIKGFDEFIAESLNSSVS